MNRPEFLDDVEVRRGALADAIRAYAVLQAEHARLRTVLNELLLAAEAWDILLDEEDRRHSGRMLWTEDRDLDALKAALALARAALEGK
jgi:hypothetical protein